MEAMLRFKQECQGSTTKLFKYSLNDHENYFCISLNKTHTTININPVDSTVLPRTVRV